MIEKLRKIRETLNRSIFVGERYERNMQNMLTESYIILVLSVLMVLVNVLKGDYQTAAAPLAFVLLGVLDIYFLKVRRSRRFSVIATTITAIIVFTYCILFVDNGFAYLWTLLLPLSVCYMFGLKEGIFISVYFEVLLIFAFYTSYRQNLTGHFPEIVLDRFPILFFFNSLITVFVMYQYHKSALFEIDYANRLNEEVARQTAVAEERSRKIEAMSLQTIETLANAIDAKDPYTKGHSSRVSQYSVKIAEALGWPEQRINDLRYAALLHDIGKIGVPDSILNNPKRLTDAEYDIIKSHTTTGAEILKNRIMISTAEDVARSHHERYDGKGYPLGLKGTEISEEARIVAIADAFDAMSSNRVYRKACGKDHIRGELLKGKGKQFDPEYTDVFIDLWDRGLLNEIIEKKEDETTKDEEASSLLLKTVLESFMTQGSTDSVDALTGLLNRAAGETAAVRMMKDHAGCLAVLDVDNLRTINETSGEKAGDLVLKRMGDTLRSCSGDNICARLGGDEFILFLKDVTQQEAEQKTREILRAFEQKTAESGTDAASLSAGLSMSEPGETYMKVFSQADKALYHVKQSGKKGLCFYNSASASYRDDALDLNRLIQAIQNRGGEDALNGEYRQFAELYKKIETLEKQYGQTLRLMMITLDPLPGTVPNPEELEISMYFMDQAIRQNVRGVDVVARCSRQQYLIVLLGTDSEGAHALSDRIFRSYYKMNGSNAYSPSCVSTDPGEKGQG